MIVGSGQFKYRVIADWAKLPDGWSFKEVGGVGADNNDNVYVFNRGEHPMIVFDREGNFLSSWGEGQYPRAHGVHMAPDDTMFLTDDGGHFVRKVTLDGKVLLELGVPGKPAPFMSGEPFHRCTHTALSPKGEIYVSDGYGNARVHKYSPDGKLLMSWGEPGTGEGEFNIVHNICCDADGWVYVADREKPSGRRSGRTCTAPAAFTCHTLTSRLTLGKSLASPVRRWWMKEDSDHRSLSERRPPTPTAHRIYCRRWDGLYRSGLEALGS
jgi:hypothetical protein